MRKLFLKIHLYSGLICFWYLIVLGTSSLNFNHHFSFMESQDTVEKWSKKRACKVAWLDYLCGIYRLHSFHHSVSEFPAMNAGHLPR